MRARRDTPERYILKAPYTKIQRHTQRSLRFRHNASLASIDETAERSKPSRKVRTPSEMMRITGRQEAANAQVGAQHNMANGEHIVIVSVHYLPELGS